MKKIIDNIANWLVTLNERKDKLDQSTATFMKRGKNALMVWAIVFGSLFTFLSVDLYQNYGKLWLALIPITLFALFLFGMVVLDSYRDKLKKRNRSTRMKLVGFNMDFNEHVLKKIYGSLTRYEYLDENQTTFSNFYKTGKNTLRSWRRAELPSCVARKPYFWVWSKLRKLLGTGTITFRSVIITSS